jgi:hypothetical protein
MTRQLDPRLARVAKGVRLVLSYCARKGRKQPLDELDQVCLDRAVDTQTVILILDEQMKRGELLPNQAAAYAEACRDRDAALAVLKIANPYRAKAN